MAGTLERLNHHYKIDEMRVAEGLLEMWKSKKYGDERKAIVTLNGEIIGKKWESLNTFYEEEMQDV